ncbi:MAG: arsenic efflux protein [Clostridiales bacterium]|nr:arsenic efflux protein [Clostridiales bacterium]
MSEILASVWDAFLDTLLDTLKVAPFLFVIYLLMEIIEHKAEEKTNSILANSGRIGPVVGGIFGAVPQCGFSAACSSLYSGGVITLGTLLSVFLSTSDEMLPIMLSQNVPALTIIKIIGYKALIGMVAGIIVDFAVHIIKKKNPERHIHDLCEQDDCECEKGILHSTLRHFVKIILYIFAISLALNIVITLIGEDNLASLFVSVPVVGSLVSGAVGLIPNCAASIVITNLYLEGIITPGVMISGLLVGAGVGLLVLFRANRRPKQNIAIAALLYGIGVFAGILTDLLQITF